MSTVDYTWTGADGDPWNPAVFPIIRTSFGAASPTPTIQADAGSMLTGGGGGGFSDRSGIVAFTADTYTDTEIDVSISNVTVGTYVQIGYRVTANITSGIPSLGYQMEWDTDANNINIYDLASDFPIGFARDLIFDYDLTYRFRVYCRGDRHRVKFWEAGTPEPPGWRIDLTDATYPGPGRVFLGLFNQFSGFPGVATYDDLHLVEIVPPPPAIRVGSFEPIVGLYVGDQPVVAAHIGGVEVPVP